MDAESTEERDPETWHHGLVATWWAEFNDDFRPHEVGTSSAHRARRSARARVALRYRALLIPYLRAGLDVDGCDVSADMIEHCRVKARAKGSPRHLFVQAHARAVDPPRMYRTVVVCGAFGLGSTCAQDVEALARLQEVLRARWDPAPRRRGALRRREAMAVLDEEGRACVARGAAAAPGAPSRVRRGRVHVAGRVVDSIRSSSASRS